MNVNLAALLIPPSLDAKQGLRMRRFGIAALSYVLAIAMVAVGWAFGEVPGRVLLEAAAAFLASNLILYWVIRSGFNLRFEDPSLTRLQILVAITVLMYIVYHMDEGRESALFGCFVVFLFGIFRLNAREFNLVTLYTVAAYALVINLLMHLRPEAIHEVPSVWLSWVGLAGFLPCFTIIGQQINTLRRRMRDRETHFRTLTEMSSDFYWETDAEHRITVQGSAGTASSPGSIFRRGAQPGERRWEMPFLSPDEAGWRAHRAMLDAHLAFRGFELSRAGIDGVERHISISGDPVLDASGAFKGYRGVGADITARKRAEQDLRQSAQKLSLLAENIPVMAVSWDENLRCRFANRMFTDFFGFTAEAVIGKHLRELLGEGVYREVEGHFLQALQGYPCTYQRLSVQKGRSRYLEIKLLPHIGDQGNVVGCFSLTTDITEHKLAQERIQRIAHQDGLTGLPNRLLLNDRLDQAIRLAKRNHLQFALLYLDLDKFKPVNDTLGHAAGDELLIGVASRIRQQVRDSDTVARVGGDEFVVILLDIAGRGRAEIVAGKIAAALAKPFQLGSPGQRVDIGSSIGIAIYPADGLDADALMKAADVAMYGAKQARTIPLPHAA